MNNGYHIMNRPLRERNLLVKHDRCDGHHVMTGSCWFVAYIVVLGLLVF